MVVPCRKPIEISHLAALQWKIVYLDVHLVTLNLHIPHGSVCRLLYWHSACGVLLSPVTFKLGLWPEMCILRRHLLTASVEPGKKMRPGCLRSFLNAFPGPKGARLTLNLVVTRLLDAKQSGAEILKGPDPPPSPHSGWIWETYVGELSWLRTSVACLEFSGRVSVYASVVNWFLSARQSPTVGRIAAPLLAVVGRYDRRHSVVYTGPAASRHDCTCWKVTW